MTLTRLVTYLCLLALGGFVVSVGVYFLLPSQAQPGFLHFGVALVALIAVLVIIIDLIFLIPTIKGAIYLPSSDAQIADMLALARIRPGERAVDIGSGDGRVVRALAAAGAVAEGFELNPILVWWSWWKSALLPLPLRGTFHVANMWSVDFAPYDVVTLFGMTYIMKDFEQKLRRELRLGARVVCNSFPFPEWPEQASRGSVHVYVKKK